MSELSITVCSFYITKRNAKKNKHIYYLNDSMKYTIDDSVYETNIQEILQVFSHRFDSPVRDENKKKTFCCKYIDKVILKNTYHMFFKSILAIMVVLLLL